MQSVLRSLTVNLEEMLNDQILRFLKEERDYLLELSSLIRGRIEAVDDLITKVGAQEQFASLHRTIAEKANPFSPRRIAAWPMTSRTAMGRCREALGLLGREATVKEITDLIRAHSLPVTKSFAEMLYKRATQEEGGIYRAKRGPGPAKYGLLAWREAGQLTSTGEYEVPEEDIPM